MNYITLIALVFHLQSELVEILRLTQFFYMQNQKVQSLVSVAVSCLDLEHVQSNHQFQAADCG